ncbi:hypothetical protein [Bartonella gabonensis]|uniref:hypothetical protein n=1 Tax=Bartonella gabonensis TaxID=2699889 RepID=UPI001FE27B99|nr:hypothetical protein [Bartonella gabonensis]
MSEFASVYECMKKAGFRYKMQDSKGIYFVPPVKSDSLLVNLMVAGYQQFMDNDTFGVTNKTKKERALLAHFEDEKKISAKDKSFTKWIFKASQPSLKRFLDKSTNNETNFKNIKWGHSVKHDCM